MENATKCNFEFKKLVLEQAAWTLHLKLSHIIPRLFFAYTLSLEFDDSMQQIEIRRAENRIKYLKENPTLLASEDMKEIEKLEDLIFRTTELIEKEKKEYAPYECAAFLTEMKNKSESTIVCRLGHESAIWFADNERMLPKYRLILTPAPDGQEVE